MSQLQHIFAHDNTPLLAFLHMPKQLVLAIFILKEESYYYYVTLKILSYFCDLCFLQFVNRPTQHSSVLFFTCLSRVVLKFQASNTWRGADPRLYPETHCRARVRIYGWSIYSMDE